MHGNAVWQSEPTGPDSVGQGPGNGTLQRTVKPLDEDSFERALSGWRALILKAQGQGGLQGVALDGQLQLWLLRAATSRKLNRLLVPTPQGLMDQWRKHPTASFNCMTNGRSEPFRLACRN